VALTIGGSLLLSLATLVFAASHNRPFDIAVRRFARN
jgi:hypothetical protein